METILITKDARVAKYAEESGVDRIMVDLEILGKKERQGHLNTVISEHTIKDVKEIKEVLNKSKLLVRVNPINKNSKKEIDDVIKFGADIIMLPMFTEAKEVKEFVKIVNRRTVTCLLLETPEALVRIDEIIDVNGIDEIHVGLNDLHLGLKLDFMFELLSGGLVEYLSKKINKKGIVFGFGGIARLGKGTLDSSLILSEHYRLKSKRVILSRDFKGGYEEYDDLIKNIDLKNEISKIHDFISGLNNDDIVKLNENKKRVKEGVLKIRSSRK